MNKRFVAPGIDLVSILGLANASVRRAVVRQGDLLPPPQSLVSILSRPMRVHGLP